MLCEKSGYVFKALRNYRTVDAALVRHLLSCVACRAMLCVAAINQGVPYSLLGELKVYAATRPGTGVVPRHRHRKGRGR